MSKEIEDRAKAIKLLRQNGYNSVADDLELLNDVLGDPLFFCLDHFTPRCRVEIHAPAVRWIISHCLDCFALADRVDLLDRPREQGFQACVVSAPDPAVSRLAADDALTGSHGTVRSWHSTAGR